MINVRDDPDVFYNGLFQYNFKKVTLIQKM